MTQPAISRLEALELPIVKVAVKDGEKTTEYQLALDYNAIAKISEVLNKDLSQHQNWWGLSGADLTVVVWGALDRFHPDIDLRTVRSWFSPPMYMPIYAMLLEAAYPGVLVAIDKAQKDEALAKQLGAPQANPAVPAAL